MKNTANAFRPEKDALLKGRRLEFFHHQDLPEWGGPLHSNSFAVLHPAKGNGKAGLYVVLHSAGHGLYSCLGCTELLGNHDIYRTPDTLYGLYLDCRENSSTDFWWGGINARGEGAPERRTKVQPVEQRVCATIEWVMENYPIDPNRVYICGNSMGGSGALGIAMCRGDLFAAVKVNVPAGVQHFLDRCLQPGVSIPDPPICVDYSAQNDIWSDGHEKFYRVMRERKFAVYGYWADFGHANIDANMLQKNDLIHSFNWLSVRRNQAYPVFTDADSDSPSPWEAGCRSSIEAGQVNAFFRWRNVRDLKNDFAMELFLTSPDELSTTFTIPKSATADVTLRRLQNFRIHKGEIIKWKFGRQSGVAQADANGLLTLPRLKMTQQKTSLNLSR